MVLNYLLIFLALFSVNSYAETTAPTPKTISTGELSGTFYGEFSLSSWQDGLTLNSVGQAPTHLIQTATGLCPGVGFRDALSKDISLDINACGFFGMAEINNDTTASAATTYSSKNNSVYGFQSAAGLLFSPGGIKHQFGIEIPILVRHSSPNGAGPGTSFASTTALQTGVQIDTRFYSVSGFCVDPKLAWFQTTHTMLWSLNFGMDL